MKPFPNKYDAKASEAALQARWAKDDAFVWDPNAPADTDYVIDTPPPTVVPRPSDGCLKRPTAVGWLQKGWPPV